MINLFKKEQPPKNLKEVAKKIESLEEKIVSLDSEVQALKSEAYSFIKKVGLVRYNALPKVGGKQSFSLALFDKRDTGFVVTSLYLEEKNRVFIKPIKEGKTEYSLSEEEKEAIKRARE